MPEFCQECPLRGDVTGEIVDRFVAEIDTIDLPFTIFGDTERIAAFADAEGGLSKPVYAHNDGMLDHLELKIDSCERPVPAIVGILFKHYGVYCPALARSVVQHRGLRKLFFAEIETKAS